MFYGSQVPYLYASFPCVCSFTAHIYAHNSNILFIALCGILFLNMLKDLLVKILV